MNYRTLLTLTLLMATSPLCPANEDNGTREDTELTEAAEDELGDRDESNDFDDDGSAYEEDSEPEDGEPEDDTSNDDVDPDLFSIE